MKASSRKLKDKPQRTSKNIDTKIKLSDISNNFGILKRKGSTEKLLKETDRELDPENYK